jgi:hypothetical protein
MLLVTMIKDVIIGCAAIVGSYVALRGLRAWQEQLKGKAKYEVSRRILLGILTIRDAIRVVRSPFISGGEIAEAYKLAGKEIPTSHSPEGESLVYKQRWEPLRKARVELHLDLLEAEAIWGKEVPALEGKLNECIVKLFSAIEMHLYDTNNPRVDASRDVEEAERRMGILYQHGDQSTDDAYQKNLLEVVDLFEMFFRPKLMFK